MHFEISSTAFGKVLNPREGQHGKVCARITGRIPGLSDYKFKTPFATEMFVLPLLIQNVLTAWVLTLTENMQLANLATNS